jgi:four helix bundle protein
MHRFKDLKIWSSSIKLVKEVYRISNKFPSREQYGLTQQIQRCTVSIAANIAEGAGRNSNKEFLNFLSIAMGSSFELFTHLTITFELKYIQQTDFDEINIELESLQKMMSGFRQNLKSKLL